MPGYFLIKLSFRAVDEIQRNIIKRGKRNVISRRYHAKDDKEAIIIWRSELGGILHVFNVRSVISAWSPLTPPLLD
jgi:RNase P protein component